MAKIIKSMEELIGATPLMELTHLEEKYGLKARLLAKMECFNPAGSAKDRVALAMLNAALQQGKIGPGATIIEPTSGNTGIGLCAIGAVRGYRTIIVMPDTMSIERIRLMKAYGAEVVLTPGELGMGGAIAKAEALAAQIPDSFIPGQFDNPDNAKAHEMTTGPEIWQDSEGKVDLFVAGVGTGGTITGTGRYLKGQKSSIRVIAVEPASSPLLSEGRSGAHGLQGIGANFIPTVLDRTVYDEIIPVTEEDAYTIGREIGRSEGILAGISSGAAAWAAIEVAKRPENEGKTIVVLFPDGGDRYLSTPMYAQD